MAEPLAQPKPSRANQRRQKLKPSRWSPGRNPSPPSSSRKPRWGRWLPRSNPSPNLRKSGLRQQQRRLSHRLELPSSPRWPSQRLPVAGHAASSSIGAKDTGPNHAQPSAATLPASEPPKVETKPAAGGVNPSPMSSPPRPGSSTGCVRAWRPPKANRRKRPAFAWIARAVAPGTPRRSRSERAPRESKPAQSAKPAETIPPLGANDLRHYLNQRIAQATRTRIEEPAGEQCRPRRKSVTARSDRC